MKRHEITIKKTQLFFSFCRQYSCKRFRSASSSSRPEPPSLPSPPASPSQQQTTAGRRRSCLPSHLMATAATQTSHHIRPFIIHNCNMGLNNLTNILSILYPIIPDSTLRVTASETIDNATVLQLTAQTDFPGAPLKTSGGDRARRRNGSRDDTLVWG